jgi:flagellar biosynthetic protein FlhB
MGSYFTLHLIRLLREGLTLDTQLAFHAEQLLPHLRELSMATLLAFLPFLMLLLLVAMFSPLLMNGWLFTLKPLQPNFSKLDPIAGIARMFSVNSLMELAKAIGKSVVVGGIGTWVVWHNKEAVLLLAGEPVAQSISHMANLMVGSFAAIMMGMLLIVAIDVPFQLWEHSKKLKMTKEEVRQESKETEGDPKVKGRIRNMQREIARRRMMSAIPTADVVVTNPTHYAVALKYSEGGMRAPVVVAKGSHLLAARIREIATEHRVPILEAPPLARALHRHCDLGETIPEALYNAVAEVLAYVYQLRRYKSQGGEMPQVPDNLPVPEELDPVVQTATQVDQ